MTKEEALESVEPGWRPLIEDLFRDMQAIPEAFGTKAVVDQVKEKFGYLTVYAAFLSTFGEGVLHGLSIASSHICEMCGNKGKLRNDRAWIKTLCDTCNGQPK